MGTAIKIDKSVDNETTFKCKECEGRGHIFPSDDNKDYVFKCPKCNGDGKLDWIENIVGKNPSETDAWFAPAGLKTPAINWNLEPPKHPKVGDAYVDNKNDIVMVYDESGNWIKIGC